MRVESIAAVPLFAFLLIALPAAAEHVHGVDCPPDVDLAIPDGQVDPGEYADWFQNSTLGMTAYLEYGSDGMLRIGLTGPAGGWLGIGLGPAGPSGDGMNFVLGAWTPTGTLFADQYFDGFSRWPDTSLGGTSDILASASVSGELASVEFVVPLAGEDPFDQRFLPGNTYEVVLAFNNSTTDPLAPAQRHTEPQPLHVVSPDEILVPRATELRLTGGESVASGATFVLVGQLVDASGNPVADARLTLRMTTTFGAVSLGEATTGSDGRARWTLSLLEAGRFQYRVDFEGGNRLLASSAQTEVLVTDSPSIEATAPLVWLIGTVVAAVLGGIWACYGFVIFQLLEIRREGRTPPDRKRASRKDLRETETPRAERTPAEEVNA